MNDFAVVYDFDRPVAIELSAPDGSRLPISVRGLDVDPGVRLRVSMQPADVARVADAGWLGLSDQPSQVDWDPDISVAVTLHLVDELDRPDVVGDGEPLLLALGGDDETSLVRNAESWRIGDALQTLTVPGDPTASLEIGLRLRD